MAESLVYLYGVADATLASSLRRGLAGVGGVPVRVLVSGRLAAVVSSVDALHFGEESLRRNLEDLSWLTATARAHHGVVDTIWRDQVIAPVRLATVYLDDDKVRALLDTKEAAFRTALDRIRGREEWGVKAFAATRPPDAEPEQAGDDPALGPGAAYLRRRRAARDRASRVRREAQAAAKELHRALTAAASATRRYQPQDPSLSGRRDDMVLNAAYLVEVDKSASFRGIVEARHAPLLQVTLTGPWAPYSFASLEEP
jgi:hypothetical protein